MGNQSNVSGLAALVINDHVWRVVSVPRDALTFNTMVTIDYHGKADAQTTIYVFVFKFTGTNKNGMRVFKLYEITRELSYALEDAGGHVSK